MHLVTKRDMDDARHLVEIVKGGLQAGEPLDEYVHDIAQAIADGRRPSEAKKDQMRRIMGDVDLS